MKPTNLNKNRVLASSIIKVSDDQIASDFMDGEKVILNLNDGMYFGLNSVGARIWSIIQEPITVQEILTTLLKEFDVDRDQCEKEVFALLNELIDHNLISLYGQ